MNVSLSKKTAGAVLICGSLLAACSSTKSAGSTPTAMDAAASVKSAAAKMSTVTSVKLHGTVAVPQGNLALDGRERFKPDLAADLTITPQSGFAGEFGGSGGSFVEVLTDGTLYLRLGSAITGDPAKPWAKIDLAQTTGIPGLSDLTKNVNPQDQLQQALAAGDLQRVGTETVDGQKTDRYAGTVDPAKLLNESSVAKNLTPDQIQQLKTALDKAGVTKEHIDLWVGALPVEVKVAVDTAAGTATVDVHLSDWNAPVTVTPPPADQVSDVSLPGV